MDIERLIQLYNDNYTFNEIAATLQQTKGAVSGRLTRLRKLHPEKFTRPLRSEMPKLVKPVVVVEKKQTPNKHTISFKRDHYSSKAQMYADLKEAVKNTQ